MFVTKLALQFDSDTMRLAAAREAVVSLGLLQADAEMRIFRLLDDAIAGAHPKELCLEWRKQGDQMSPDDKKAAGIRKNAFYSRDAYAELSDAGRARPMDAHDTTLLRAVFTMFRYRSVVEARRALKPQDFEDRFKSETLHMKCEACNAIDGVIVGGDDVALFPPDGCTCETANYGVRPEMISSAKSTDGPVQGPTQRMQRLWINCDKRSLKNRRLYVGLSLTF